MTLHSPLTVTERWRHDFDVFPDTNRSQPFGTGATVAYNYVDLQIKNNAKIPYLLRLYLTDTHLHGEWLSTEPSAFTYSVYEKEHLMTTQVWGGFTRHNKIFRQTKDLTGKIVADEFIVENHAYMMYAPFLASGNVSGTDAV